MRIIVNDGVVALPRCTSGPGSSCPLDELLARVKGGEQEWGGFREVCGLEADRDGVEGIQFLHQ